MSAWVYAIDPGDVHVGWAMWTAGWGGGEDQFEAGEIPNDSAARRVNMRLSSQFGRGVLVIEEFRLYGGDTLGSQIHKTMDTSELIGALKYVAAQRRLPVVMQGAAIQKPTEAQLRARGIELIAAGPHAKSAQLHLWHYLLKKNLVRRRAA